MPGLLDVTVLGPVRAWVDGGEVPIRGRLGRTVLAALALESGRALSVEQLIDALWGELPPATARQQVHIQVSRLRAAFGRAGAVDVIRTEPGGYRLVAHRVDVREVARLREAALAAGHPDAAAATLRAALELWRGVPLGGISGCLAQAESPRLDELFLCLVEERVDAELAGGHAAGLVPELTGLVGAHPFREGLRFRLMQALYRSGRRADALRAFQDARQVLRDELGMDPPRALVELEAEILAAGPPGDEPAGVVVPAQLPPGTPGFAGRTAELAELHAVLTRPGGPRLVLITGMPGVGKTTLAIHAGTAALAAFPDGQLYADLRGADARPARPMEVLAGFLRALGVPARSMPTDVTGRTAEFRSRTAGRRMLIVLDNAATADLVEALLPAEPACMTIVTSRFVLPDVESATRVPLAPLPDDVARAVLVNVAGVERFAEPEPFARIVTACAGVPLALRIVAAQLAAFPALSVTELAARLADEPSRMRTFTVGHKSVRGSLDLSFRLLDRDATRAMVALAALGSPTFTGWPLASLLGRPADRSDELVERLASMHLLEPVGPGMDGVARYRMHDLVRAYCRAVRRELDQDAADRLVGWAVGLAAHAYQGIIRRPTRYPVVAESATDLGPDVLGQVIKEPLAWVGADVDVLLAAFDLAVHHGRLRAAAALLLVLRVPMVRLDLLDHLPRAAARLDRLAASDPVVGVSAALVAASTRLHRGWYTDAVRALTAVRPALADVDPAIRAEVLLMLGDAYERCCDVPNALAALREAAQWFAACGDTTGHASCHASLSTLNLNQVNDIEAAVWHAGEALRLADIVGDWKMSALARVAVVHAGLAAGDLPTARRRADEAIALAERDGDPVGQTWCLVLNAQVRRADGDLTEARTATDRALELARRIRRPDAESAAHLERARIELDAGDRPAARGRAQAALALADRFDSPVERGRIEQLLAQLADDAG